MSMGKPLMCSESGLALSAFCRQAIRVVANKGQFLGSIVSDLSVRSLIMGQWSE